MEPDWHGKDDDLAVNDLGNTTGGISEVEFLSTSNCDGLIRQAAVN